MKKQCLFLLFVVLLAGISSCKKDVSDDYILNVFTDQETLFEKWNAVWNGHAW